MSVDESKLNLGLGIAVNQIVGGYLYQGGDLLTVPKLLREIADDWEDSINKEAKTT